MLNRLNRHLCYFILPLNYLLISNTSLNISQIQNRDHSLQNLKKNKVNDFVLLKNLKNKKILHLKLS